MIEEQSRLRRGTIILFFLGIFAVTVVPIYSYDYFWHLATGRWIVDHQALPATDPFGVASARIPWINGEWLYQIVLYSIFSLGRHEGVALVHGAGVATLFTLTLIFSARYVGAGLATFATTIAWLGASHRLGVRPESMATVCLAGCVAVLLQKPDGRRLALYVGLTLFWINVHPSALLAPVLATMSLIGEAMIWRLRAGEPGALRWRAGIVAGSALALLANPHGLEGVIAPIRLSRMVQAGRFINTEWLPSRPMTFPLLYLVILVGAFLLIREKGKSLEGGRILIFAFLALLACRFVRNQGLFFAVIPLLLAPALPTLRSKKWEIVAFAGAALLIAGTLLDGRRLRVGIDHQVFPVHAVSRLQALRLPGNIYNPDQFGGYLIWMFYPERRVLTDGRNELYQSFLPEYEKARRDSQAWTELLRKYRLTLAVDEYRGEPVPVVDAMSGKRHFVPASLVYFPRQRWALVAFDDRAMVFAERTVASPVLLDQIEYRQLVPDAREPAYSDPVRAAEEIARAHRQTAGRSRVVKRLENALAKQSG